MPETLQSLRANPDFQGLPLPEKHKVMLSLLPDYKGLPASEQSKALNVIHYGAPPPTSDADTSSVWEGIKGALGEQAKGMWQDIKDPLNYLPGVGPLAKGVATQIVAPQVPLIKRAMQEGWEELKHPLTPASPLVGLHRAEALMPIAGPMAANVEEVAMAGRGKEAAGRGLVYGGELAAAPIIKGTARVVGRTIVGAGLNLGKGFEGSLKGSYDSALKFQKSLAVEEDASYKSAGAKMQAVQDAVDTAQPKGIIDPNPLLAGIGEHAQEVVKVPDKYPASFKGFVDRLKDHTSMTFGELKQWRTKIYKDVSGSAAENTYTGPVLNVVKNAYGEASESLKAAAEAVGKGKEWMQANAAFTQHADDFWRSPLADTLKGKNAGEIMNPLLGDNMPRVLPILDKYLDPNVTRAALRQHEIMARGRTAGTPSKWEAMFAAPTGGLSLARPAVFRPLQRPGVANWLARFGAPEASIKTPPPGVAPEAAATPTGSLSTPAPSAPPLPEPNTAAVTQQLAARSTGAKIAAAKASAARPSPLQALNPEFRPVTATPKAAPTPTPESAALPPSKYATLQRQSTQVKALNERISAAMKGKLPSEGELAAMEKATGLDLGKPTSLAQFLDTLRQRRDSLTKVLKEKKAKP